jgi:CRP-like cAMP-binding protein
MLRTLTTSGMQRAAWSSGSFFRAASLSLPFRALSTSVGTGSRRCIRPPLQRRAISTPVVGPPTRRCITVSSRPLLHRRLYSTSQKTQKHKTETWYSSSSSNNTSNPKYVHRAKWFVGIMTRLTKWFTRERQFVLFGRTFTFWYSEVAGHLSFALLTLSFSFRDVFWLRALALFSGVSGLCFQYWHPTGRPLWLPLRWNVMFVLTNLGQFLNLLYDEKKVSSMSKREVGLYHSMFRTTGISQQQFLKLLDIGSWRTFEKGEKLTVEGQNNRHVYVVWTGEVSVSVRGRRVYNITSGQFIGEMGLHAGVRVADALRSGATCECDDDTVVFEWPRQQLIALMDDSVAVAAAIESAVSNDLIKKMLQLPKNDAETRRKKACARRDKVTAARQKRAEIAAAATNKALEAAKKREQAAARAVEAARMVASTSSFNPLSWSSWASVAGFGTSERAAAAAKAAVVVEEAASEMNAHNLAELDGVNANDENDLHDLFTDVDDDAKEADNDTADQLFGDKNIDLYRTLLGAVLAKGTCSAHQRGTLARFKAIHKITDEVHEQNLVELSWTGEQYERGHREEAYGPVGERATATATNVGRAVMGVGSRFASAGAEMMYQADESDVPHGGD